MAKSKSMGTEYQISAEGNWGQIAEAVRTTKKLVENTRTTPRTILSITLLSLIDDNNLENGRLKAFLVPKEGETFFDYQNRFARAFARPGLLGKLFKPSLGKKVPFKFTLTRNDGESTLALSYIAKEEMYAITIDASGNYSRRGASIAEGIKAHLEQNKMQFKYETLERLI